MKKIAFQAKILIFVFSMSFVFYGNTLNNQFSLDDNYIFTKVPKKVNSLQDATAVFYESFDDVDYRPIAMFSFALEKLLLGDIKPRNAHLINILLFALGSYFFFLLVSQLDHTPHKILAIVATIIFIAHPIHSNVVASLKNRDTLFSFMFSISSFLFWIRFVQFKRYYNLIPCVLLFFLALFSKLDAVWLIFMIPIYYLLETENFNWKLIFRTGIIAAVVLILFVFIRKMIIDEMVTLVIDKNPILTSENPIVNDNNLLGRIYYAGLSMFYYLKFMLVPFGYYFYFGYKTTPSLHFFQPYFLIGTISTIILLVIAFRSRRKGGLLTFSILFFLTALIFCSNLIQPVAGIVAPRLAFQASAGFSLFAAIIILNIARRFQELNLLSEFKVLDTIESKTFLLTIMIALFLFPFTFSRNKDWKNPLTLIEADIPNLYNSYQANRIATATYLRAAQNVQDVNLLKEFAVKGFNAASNANKVDPNSLYTQEAVGISYRLLGMRDSAIAHFSNVVLQFDTSEVAWDMMGDMYVEEKNYKSAVNAYKNTIRVSPKYDQAYYKFTRALVAVERINYGIEEYQQMITADSTNWYVLYDNLGYLYLQNKDTLNAAKAFINVLTDIKDKKLFISLSNYLIRNGYTLEQQELSNAYSTPIEVAE